MVLVSAGFANRYGHPRATVLDRYQQLGLPVLNTAEHGALQLYWVEGQSIQLRTWRKYGKRFWFER